MEQGRTEQIIDKLTEIIENGQSVPLSTGKVVVNKDETISLLRELASIVTGELKMYREFNDRKGKIITDAKKEAEDIIYEAEQTASRIRVTKRISGMKSGLRTDNMSNEDKMALRTAGDIYAASLVYTDEMLTEVNDVVAQAYDCIHNEYGKMIDVLNEKARLIAENKAELMSSLKELEQDERYEQILELGQLLSNELYSERMKAREMEENGSYQMELQFEEEKTAKEEKKAEGDTTVKTEKIAGQENTAREEIAAAKVKPQELPVIKEKKTSAVIGSNPVENTLNMFRNSRLKNTGDKNDGTI